MPIASKRKAATMPSQDVIDYTESPELKPVAPRKPRATKDVPVGKIISSTLETRIAGTMAKATSMSMLNTVGENVAITANEAYNIWHPITKMLGRRVPDIALKTNLSKPDADDLETIILTIVEYMARIVDSAFTRAYNKRVRKLNSGQNTMNEPTQREQPSPRMMPTIEPELEEFTDTTSGPDPDIAPMRNGGGSIADLIERGYIPRDMGENIA
jgi:hypothetical protein